MLGITNKITNKQYIILFIASVLIPSFITWALGKGMAFIIHYWLLMLFCYLTVKTNKKLMYALLAYALATIFLFHSATLGERTFFAVSFLLTAACLYGLNDLDIDLEGFTLKQISTVFVVLLFCYIISINPSRQTYDGRVYYHGFVIAHHYAYLAAFFGYFFIRQEKIWLGVAIVFSGVLVGTRSGLLVSMMPFVYLAKRYFVKIPGSKVRKTVLLSVVCFFVLVPVFFLFQKQIVPTIQTFTNFSVESVVENDEEAMADFSASRTFMWALMFTQVAEDGFTLPNLIGRGPASSLDFLGENFDARIWMHNDFFDIFFCYGLVGLCLYIFCIVCYYRRTKDIYFLFMLLIAAFTNGFYPYMAVQLIALHTLFCKLNRNIKKSDNA
jgi:hypothetical protein